MSEIKEIAVKILNLNEETLCRCGGEHDLCLFCNQCRADGVEQIVKETDSIAGIIDHTILRANANTGNVKDLCDEANHYHFKSICINPCFINYAKYNIHNSLICTVVGFPLGANFSESKYNETRQAIEAGAQEIDMVINIGLLKENFHQFIFEEISHIYNICKKSNVLLKVIIETCLLTEEEIITACLLAKKAGADFVKTSTGFSTNGAEADKVKLMRKVVGNKMGVKASGGIKTREDAIKMINAGANRLGTSNSVNIVKGE